MTSMYDDIPERLDVAVAHQIIDAHRNTPGQSGPAPGCPNCGPAGCPQLVSANRRVARHREARAGQLAAQ